MHLVYFDENKYEEANPYFWIGGVLIPEPKAIECDKTLQQIQFNVLGKMHLAQDSELHGKNIFHSPTLRSPAPASSCHSRKCRSPW